MRTKESIAEASKAEPVTSSRVSFDAESDEQSMKASASAQSASSKEQRGVNWLGWACGAVLSLALWAAIFYLIF